MHPQSMKHKASIWEGDCGSSRHITDVHWEGDITQAELMDVADQITSEWQTIDLELDPAHPSHGRVFRLHRPASVDLTEADDLRRAEAEAELADRYVWVHCCRHVDDADGDNEDEAGRAYRQVFHTLMFCTEFTSFDDIAAQCDDALGQGEWDGYELYLDDDLPAPVASYG